MQDPTEGIRILLATEINSNPDDRQTLEMKYGQVWNTEELSREFNVVGFFAPFVMVERKVDGARGSLTFQHHPRFYFDFCKS
jgi:hypothetical protein